MAVMESIEFCYNGLYSSDFGIYNVSLDNGLFSEPFLAPKAIIETKIRGNDKPYFSGVEYEPLKFTLSFAFANAWDDAKIREVARWLNQDYYKPLWFSENPSRIFYCMIVDETELVHNGLKQGYIKLNVRCDSPYTYSPVLTLGTIDYSLNSGTQTLEFVNDGDLVLKPEMWIKKVGNGDITIVNKTNGNKMFKLSSLINGETVFIDNERQHIETDVPNEYRFSNFNNTYLQLVRGKNVLEITGACTLDFRYQYKTLQ